MNADALIATPGPITYCTPRIDMESLIEVDQIAELDDEFNDLQFSAHGSSSQAQGVGLHVAESNNTNLGAQNEHKEKQARSLVSDFSTQPESIPIQETEDGEHAQEFVGPWGLRGQLPRH